VSDEEDSRPSHGDRDDQDDGRSRQSPCR
jgi:hypothetical protein